MLLHRHRGAARYAAAGATHWIEHYAGGGARTQPWTRELALADSAREDAEAERGPCALGALCPLAQYLARAAPAHNASEGVCAARLRSARRRVLRQVRAAVAAPRMPPWPRCVEYVDAACGREAQRRPFFSWPFPVL